VPPLLKNSEENKDYNRSKNSYVQANKTIQTLKYRNVHFTFFFFNSTMRNKPNPNIESDEERLKNVDPKMIEMIQNEVTYILYIIYFIHN